MGLDISELLEMDEGAGRRLRELLERVQGDRTQRQFARDLEISPGALQSWLGGQIPKPENLEKIAIASGMSVEQLFRYLQGEDVVLASARVAEDVLQVALQLDNEQRRRLIHLLIDNI